MPTRFIIGSTLLTGLALLAMATAPVRAGEAASEALRKRGADLVAKIDHVMLGTVDADGYPQIRIMANFHKQGTKIPMDKDGQVALYFVTNRNSAKVAQFRNNPKASAYYLDLPSGTAVLYNGVMEEVDDPAVAKALWADWMKPLYQTVDNPDLLVIRLVANRIKVDRHGRSEQGEL